MRFLAFGWAFWPTNVRGFHVCPPCVLYICVYACGDFPGVKVSTTHYGIENRAAKTGLWSINFGWWFVCCFLYFKRTISQQGIHVNYMLISLYGHLLIHQYIYIWKNYIFICWYLCMLLGGLINQWYDMNEGWTSRTPSCDVKKKSAFSIEKKHITTLLWWNFIHVCCQVSLGSPIFFGIGIPRKSWAVYWHDTHEVNDSGCVDKMQFRKVVRMLQDDGRDGGCSQISDLPSGKHTKSYWKWCFIVKWIF